MKNKKIISLLLTFAMLLSMVPSALNLSIKADAQTTQKTAETTLDYDIFDSLEVLKQLVNMIELTPFEEVVYETDGAENISIFDALEILKSLVGMRTLNRIMPDFPPTVSQGLATQKAGGGWTLEANGKWKPPVGWQDAAFPWEPPSNWVKGGDDTWGPVDDDECTAIDCTGDCKTPVPVDDSPRLSQAAGVTSEFRNLTARQLVSEIRTGWNLGNTFDGHTVALGKPAEFGHELNNVWPDGALKTRDVETIWLAEKPQIAGQTPQRNANYTRPTLIKDIKRQGFDAIRIPVTWYKVMDKEDNYKIHPAFMTRIKEVVNWALEEDMYVILNSHHEEYVMPIASFDPADTGKKTPLPITQEDAAFSEMLIKNLWGQISAEFKTECKSHCGSAECDGTLISIHSRCTSLDCCGIKGCTGVQYTEKLIFEGLNEPRSLGSAGEWSGGTEHEREFINVLAQDFVDTVRASGGNNKYRVLMVPSYAASARANSTIQSVIIPEDTAENTTDGVSHKIALSLHAYVPDNFALSGSKHYWYKDNPTDSGAIITVFERMKKFSDDLKVPIILGEWGSPNQWDPDNPTVKNTDFRAAHARFYVREARARGMATLWWDNSQILPAETTDQTSHLAHTYALFTRQTITKTEVEGQERHMPTPDITDLYKIKDSIMCGAGPARTKIDVPKGPVLPLLEDAALILPIPAPLYAVGQEYKTSALVQTLSGDVAAPTPIRLAAGVQSAQDEAPYDIFDALEILKNLVGMISLTDFEKEVYTFNGDATPTIFDALEILKGLVGMTELTRNVPDFPPVEEGGLATEKAGGTWTQLDDGSWIPNDEDWGNIISESLWTPEKAGLNWVRETTPSGIPVWKIPDVIIETTVSEEGSTSPIEVETRSLGTEDSGRTTTAQQTGETTASSLTPVPTSTIIQQTPSPTTTATQPTPPTTTTKATDTTAKIDTTAAKETTSSKAATTVPATTTAPSTTSAGGTTTVPATTTAPFTTTAGATTMSVPVGTTTNATVTDPATTTAPSSTAENATTTVPVITTAFSTTSAGETTATVLTTTTLGATTTVTTTAVTAATTPLPVGAVIYDMQSDPNLPDLKMNSSSGSHIPFIRASGSSGTILSLGLTANPKTVTVTNREGTSQGLRINVADITPKPNHTYRIEYTGYFPNAADASAVARIRLELTSTPLATATAVNGQFTVYATRTAAEITEDSATFYSLGNESGKIDIVYTGVRIIEVSPGGNVTTTPVVTATNAATTTKAPTTTTPVVTTTKAPTTTAYAVTTTKATTATTPVSNKYTITFSYNYTGSPASFTVQTRSSGEIPTADFPADPTRSGYTFEGWYDTASSSGGNKITPGSSGGTKFTANATVYARWKEDSVSTKYTITFSYNYTGSPANFTVETYNTGKIPSADFPADPARSGYTFEGWYTSASGGTKVSGSYIYTANTTVYAQWTKISDGTISATLTAEQLVSKMGVGWNLGNTFDGKLSWGNGEPTAALIKGVKDAGFNTIRIPVTWNGNFSASSGTVTSSWMDKVKKAVDLAVAQNMYIIINVHHDDGIFPLGESQRTKSNEDLGKLWTAIGNTFKNYDEKLIFEGRNEPKTNNDFTGKAEWWESVNQQNQAFVNAVRKTGGNNANRILMVPTYAANGDSWKTDLPLYAFKKPKDDTTSVNKLAWSIHKYVPEAFTINGTSKSWSESNVTDLLTKISAQAKKLGMPVVLGEWGMTNQNNTSERARYAEFYVKTATKLGKDDGTLMKTVLWDNGTDGNGEEFHKYFDRNSGANTYPTIIAAILKGAGITK